MSKVLIHGQPAPQLLQPLDLPQSPQGGASKTAQNTVALNARGALSSPASSRPRSVLPGAAGQPGGGPALEVVQQVKEGRLALVGQYTETALRRVLMPAVAQLAQLMRDSRPLQPS